MHGNIANYIRAVKNGIGGVSGIVFQFPLYAGIMGMIKYSGLVEDVYKRQEHPGGQGPGRPGDRSDDQPLRLL